MWTGKNWQLHHDNAPAHSARVIKDFLAKNNTALVRQPPTLLIWHQRLLAVAQVKNYAKRTRFQSRKDIIEKNDGGAQKQSRVLKVLRKVAEALGKVCALARGVF